MSNKDFPDTDFDIAGDAADVVGGMIEARLRRKYFGFFAFRIGVEIIISICVGLLAIIWFEWLGLIVAAVLALWVYFSFRRILRHPRAPKDLANINLQISRPAEIAGLETRKCPSCNKELLASLRTCHHCGKRLPKREHDAVN